MSFASLGIGSSALLATQRAVDIVSHNIANSAVDGYTRQTGRRSLPGVQRRHGRRPAAG